MKGRYMLVVGTTLTLLAGCNAEQKNAQPLASSEQSGIATTVTEVDAAALPPEVLNVVTNAIPGIQIEAAERKEREGRVYYDVEGKRPDGRRSSSICSKKALCIKSWRFSATSHGTKHLNPPVLRQPLQKRLSNPCA